LVRKTGVIVAVLLAALAIVMVARYGGTPSERISGKCGGLPLEGTVEDIRRDDLGVAYVSAGNTIWLVDLNVREPRPRAALASEPTNFRPKGISLFGNRLFAVDRHDDGASQIMIFEKTVTGAYALAEKPLRDDLLTAPDAVRAVGPQEFYVANEATSFFRDPTALYYDGAKLQVVTDGSAAAPTQNLTVTRGNVTLLAGEDRKLTLCRK
jgi:hypothetical protein